MFIGEYQHNIDDKGRLAVPIKFRNDLAMGAVVTRGLDNCLFVYTNEEWQKMADKLASLPISKSNTRAFARLMLAGAMDVSLDKQGRIILPDYLRKYAKVNKKVVITGLYNRLEIWDETAWETYRNSTEENSGDIAEAMGEIEV
ncbi:MAG: division/cell wall cluster transcriptional repressor MraZ [Patescibacteria group bacterium]